MAVQVPNTEIVSGTLDLALESGRIKRDFGLTLTDSYVIAAAKMHKGKALFKKRETEMSSKSQALLKNILWSFSRITSFSPLRRDGEAVQSTLTHEWLGGQGFNSLPAFFFSNRIGETRPPGWFRCWNQLCRRASRQDYMSAQDLRNPTSNGQEGSNKVLNGALAARSCTMRAIPPNFAELASGDENPIFSEAIRVVNCA